MDGPSRRSKPGKMQPALSSPNLLMPPSREEVVLEFYNPHLRVGREGGGLSESMKRALVGLDRIGPTSPQTKCVSFVDPLEDATKRDLRKSHLLHPLPSVASPKKPTPTRCQRCFSSNVVYVPSCAYCEKLQLLSNANTLAKRFAFNLLEREPTIPPQQLLDSVFGYLYELQDPVTANRDVLAIRSDVVALEANNGSGVSKDEAAHMIRSAEAAPSALAATRDAILELKQARASIVTSKVVLSQPTKVSLVQYLLDTFAQPSGAGADWTREQRWDHQDMCVEMLKLLSTDDVDDVLRTYNAWKHVNEVNQKQRAMERAWKQRLFQTTVPEKPRNVQTPGDDDEDDDCETTRQNVDRPLTLRQKKANRVSVSEEHRRTLIAQHHSGQRGRLPTKTASATASSAPLPALKELPPSSPTKESDAESNLQQLFLTAERYRSASSNGMFHIDHLGLLEQAGLSTHDLATVAKFDRRTQMVYLLADENDRVTLLHLSSLGRVNRVAEWLERNVDNETLLIAATSAKGQLLSTEERRLILAMDDIDVRYHLSFWKQLQQTRAHKKAPATSVHFLHLNLPHHERDSFFRVPRYWQKLIKARDPSVQPMPIAVIRPFVLQLYIRCAQETVDEYDLAEFVVEHMTLSFGAATHVRLQGFITALEQYHTKDSWLYTFCRFCHITERLPAGCFRFYLSAVLCLRFSTPNRSQIADYIVPKELFHPLLATKAKMALQAIARDAHVRDEHWLATFTEMRTVCPRTKGVVSNHLHVVGLSVFMDLVLGIWEANRESMTKEMRALFEQFDTDHSKSLSYAEFKAFITHCSATLEAKTRPHSPLRGASLSSLLGPKNAPERRHATSSPRDEKDIIKLYAKCLMQSDKDEVNVESFVLGGLDNPLILTLLGFPVPPTHTSAAGVMALQLVTRAVRAYIHRKRSRAAAKAKASVS